MKQSKIYRFFRILLSRVFFRGSKDFWEKSYGMGNDAGSCAWGEIAEHKANVLNKFFKEEKIQSVIDFGCGDGEMLRWLELPRYLGLDVSKIAIKKCEVMFRNDSMKKFEVYDTFHYSPKEKFDVSMSLDVIYHLVEDKVFEKYMQDLFASAIKYVIIFSYNEEDKHMQAPHVKARHITPWIEKNIREWKLVKEVEDPVDTGGLRARFFIYKKNSPL